MIGSIQKKEFSKNGAPKYQISGTWYFISRECEPHDFPIGTSVEFEYEEFGEDRGRGKPRAIKSWKPAKSSLPGGPSLQTITEVDVLRSVSNVVGSACAAGTVKTPEELEKWFMAAWSGLTRKPSAKKPEPEKEPDFDDEIQF